MSGGRREGYLLDTGIALQALSDPGVLSPVTRKAVLAGPNHLNVITYWGVMLKSMKGTLDVGDPSAWWSDALDYLAATPLVLSPAHVAGIYILPSIHRDPFDRALVAQARAEELALVSTDGQIVRYASKDLRVVV